MGEIAYMAIIDCITMEMLRESFASGEMGLSEAYDHGFVDELGVEQEGIQEAWDRLEIWTKEGLDNEISHASKDFTIAELRSDMKNKPSKPRLNHGAIKNLSKEYPTCNTCEELMTPCNGRYGKFYYCPNSCKEQKTVSDSYWQKIKDEYKRRG